MHERRAGDRALQWARTVLFQFGFWILVNLVFTVIFMFGKAEPTAPEEGLAPGSLYLPLLESLPWIVFGSLLFSVIIGSTDFVEQLRPRSKHTFFFQVFRTFVFHLSGLVVGCLIPILAWLALNRNEAPRSDMAFFLPRASAIVFFALIALMVLSYVRQLGRNIGKENMLRILLGTYHHPRAERWIFMFLDLKDSTAIAERLGHLSFAALIQDLFFILNAVSARYAAEIHKYVGDEAILCWKAGRPEAAERCLDFFFAFRDALERDGERFRAAYGLRPEFKAGIHLGEVTVAEVGDLKREIAFYGDVVNTTARIEAACNRFGHALMASSEFLQALRDEGRPLDASLVESFPDIELKGKEQKVSLHGIGRG